MVYYFRPEHFEGLPPPGPSTGQGTTLKHRPATPKASQTSSDFSGLSRLEAGDRASANPRNNPGQAPAREQGRLVAFELARSAGKKARVGRW